MQLDNGKGNHKVLMACFLGLDVLINNAGANWAASLHDYPDAAFEKVINLNLKRIFSLSQA